jgi:hypothetical protein
MALPMADLGGTCNADLSSQLFNWSSNGCAHCWAQRLFLYRAFGLDLGFEAIQFPDVIDRPISLAGLAFDLYFLRFDKLSARMGKAADQGGFGLFVASSAIDL